MARFGFLGLAASLALSSACGGKSAGTTATAGTDAVAQSGSHAAHSGAGGERAAGGGAGSKGGAGGATPVPSDFIDVVTLMTVGSVVIEKVSYYSDQLRIFGIVCRPTDTNRHAVIVVNHGGFEGIETSEVQAQGLCQSAARNGFVVVQSGYRGEPLFKGNMADVSEGAIEVCLGEVDDVQNLMHIVRKQPYADPERFAAFGGSHGGCITQQLALREPTLRAAVDFFGPSEFGAQFDWWRAQLAQGETISYCPNVALCQSVHQSLIMTLEKATGGTPSSVPAEYEARSPSRQLAALSVPIIVLHGTDDYFVNVEQTCLKRAALTAAGHPPAAWYLGPDLKPLNPSDVCGGGFRTGPTPDLMVADAWTSERAYVFIYQGQGHGFTSGSAAETHANAAALTFLAAHLR
jgi:dienelactone hydrolase